MRVSKPIDWLLSVLLTRNTPAANRDVLVVRRLMPTLASAAILIWIAGFYTITTTILEGSVRRIEKLQSQQQTERVVNYLSEELNKLDKIVGDYSQWDATYDFMKTANPNYISSDLGSALDYFQLNLVAFIRPSGEIIYGTTYIISNKQKKPLPAELLHYVDPQSNLLKNLGLNTGRTGFIELPQGIMLVAARSIITSAGKGPATGTIVMGKYLNEDYTQQIRKRIGLEFNLQSLPNAKDIGKGKIDIDRVPSYKNVIFQELDSKEFASYTKLKDIDKQPNLVLQVKSPRIANQQTQLSLYYLRISLIGLGLLAWGIVLFSIAKLSQYLQERDRIQTILSEKQEALFQEKELAQITLQSIGDGVIATDSQGRIKSMNYVAEKLTGWEAKRAINLPLNEVLQIFDEQTEEPVTDILDRVLQDNCAIINPISNYVLINSKGERFDIDRSIAPICDSTGRMRGSVIAIRDVTQARHHSRQLSWQASYDALTGLINRRELEHRLEQALASSKAENQEHCLCFLDLDRFKIVNDTCGHLAGDELLRQIGILLKNQVRKTDTVARLGGDEFALLLYQCSLTKAKELAQQICQRVETFRFVWQGKAFTIGVSLGLVAIAQDAGDSRSILVAADRACYAAKRRGRGGVEVYDSDSSVPSEKEAQIDWKSTIEMALAENRFRLYYQPISCLKSPSASGECYEVLMRLIDQNNNLLLPAVFMPSAERYHLMQRLDRWVIEHLFNSQKERYQEAWQRFQNQGKRSLFSINLSVETLNDETFIAFLEDRVNAYNIPTNIIAFEIPETIAVGNLSQTIKLAQQLKEMGFNFGLDRFGGGISSFEYLKNLPVDFIKIDGCLIAEILEDPVTLAIVESIQRIGELMGIKTMAEFVTDEAITEKIMELGIDYAQGYGIGEPLPL